MKVNKRVIESKAVLMVPESGDWEALYVDGKLVAENHSLDAAEVIAALIGADNYTYVQVPDELAENGFEKRLKDQLRKRG